MIVFPAIDLYDGEVVRLRQGKLTEKTVYPGTPVSFAQRWVADGARWLHVVDLNAAFEGEQRNLQIIKQIVATARVPIQCGGGVRSLEAADALFQVGVARVIIGTLAIERPEVIEELLGKYSPERIGVGVDARDGLVAVRGWAEVTQVKALDLVSRLYGHCNRWRVGRTECASSQRTAREYSLLSHREWRCRLRYGHHSVAQTCRTSRGDSR
jgi:phosphoribosylformimino-5-aminoimidazole carboxamide ribotide isomerase